MKQRILTTSILILIGVLALVACGGGGASTPTPAATGAQITLITDPDPPVMGPVELIVEVKDAQGQPLDGANVLVLASHTDMSGMDQQGQATSQGNGRYAIMSEFSDMSGEWLVTVQVRKDDLNLAQDFRIEVR